MVGVRELAQARDAVAVVADGFDARRLTLADAATAVRHAAAIRNMAATIESLAAARVAEGPAWRSAGYSSPAEWLAAQSGTSVGKAKEAIDTGKRLGALTDTVAAARRGELSREQAAAVADAAAVNPGAETQLVAAASKASLTELRTECVRAKAAADADPEATHRRIHRARRLRFFADAEGGANLAARTTVDHMAPIKAAIDDMTEEMFASARRDARHEPREAYALDALAEICRRFNGNDALAPVSGAPGRRQPRRRVKYLGLIRADLTALRRGAVEGDEACEIAGIGPVPVRVARELLGDAALHLVLTRGVDVANVTSLSRSPSQAMRVALLWLSPGCTVAGCNRPGAEIDHRADWHRTHRTRFLDLDFYCRHHHDQKSHEGWALVSGVGKRTMVPPDDPRHPDAKARPPPAGSARAQDNLGVGTGGCM